MKTVSVWNHKSSINGFESDEVIKRKKIKDTDEIIIVTDEYDFVEEIQFVNILKKNYNMPKDMSLEDVVIEYQKIINNTDNNTTDNLYLVEQANRISTLEQGLANAEYSLMMGGLL